MLILNNLQLLNLLHSHHIPKLIPLKPHTLHQPSPHNAIPINKHSQIITTLKPNITDNIYLLVNLLTYQYLVYVLSLDLYYCVCR